MWAYIYIGFHYDTNATIKVIYSHPLLLESKASIQTRHWHPKNFFDFLHSTSALRTSGTFAAPPSSPVSVSSLYVRRRFFLNQYCPLYRFPQLSFDVHALHVRLTLLFRPVFDSSTITLACFLFQYFFITVSSPFSLSIKLNRYNRQLPPWAIHPQLILPLVQFQYQDRNTRPSYSSHANLVALIKGNFIPRCGRHYNPPLKSGVSTAATVTETFRSWTHSTPLQQLSSKLPIWGISVFCFLRAIHYKYWSYKNFESFLVTFLHTVFNIQPIFFLSSFVEYPRTYQS